MYYRLNQWDFFQFPFRVVDNGKIFNGLRKNTETTNYLPNNKYYYSEENKSTYKSEEVNFFISFLFQVSNIITLQKSQELN